jgi:hypothetical protein
LTAAGLKKTRRPDKHTFDIGQSIYVKCLK